MTDKPTWQLDDDERISLARQRLQKLDAHLAAHGVTSLKDVKSNSLNLRVKDDLLVLTVSLKEPRHFTLQKAFLAPTGSVEKQMAAAYFAAQNSIISKVRIDPGPTKTGVFVVAEFFSDDIDDVCRVLPLYIAAIRDTFDAYVTEMTRVS